MKKVVLFGDSIRLQYCERVKELLQDICEVYYPEENCAYTLNTLWHIREWIAAMKVDHIDLIHWNNGIWDHHRTTDDGEPLSTVEQYLYLNRRLHKQMATYTDKLVWATTIPAGIHYKVVPNWLLSIPRDEWNAEVEEYNHVLSSYLATKGVWINDLYTLIGASDDNIGEDGIHLTEIGTERAAQQVAAVIRARLEAEA